MSRFLVVVPPLAGHVHPTVAVAAELARRGHEVTWIGEPDLLRELLPIGADIWPSPAPVLPERPAALRGFAALKFLWEQVLLPLAAAMAPDVEEATRALSPDVLLVDQQALGGALVAERRGLPWATSASTSAELTDPLAGLPKVQEWLGALLDDLRVRLGDPAATGDLRFSPHLVLAYTTEALLGGTALPTSGPVCFVGPTRGRQSARVEPSTTSDGSPPLVFVSLGTVSAPAARRFLTAALDALRERPHLRAVVVAPQQHWDDVPPHVEVRDQVAQVEVLARARAVLCHGGHNTVCEALSFGLPLVVAPIRDDQSIVAEQVVKAGAGLRIRFDRSDVRQVGAALDRILAEPGFTDDALRLQRSFAAAPGAQGAADRLEALVPS